MDLTYGFIYAVLFSEGLLSCILATRVKCFLILLVLKLSSEECCSKCKEAELHHFCFSTPLLFWDAFCNPLGTYFNILTGCSNNSAGAAYTNASACLSSL